MIINEKFRNLLLLIFISIVIWISYEAYIVYKGPIGFDIEKNVKNTKPKDIDKNLIEDLSKRISY